MKFSHVCDEQHEVPWRVLVIWVAVEKVQVVQFVQFKFELVSGEARIQRLTIRSEAAAAVALSRKVALQCTAQQVYCIVGLHRATQVASAARKKLSLGRNWYGADLEGYRLGGEGEDVDKDGVPLPPGIGLGKGLKFGTRPTLVRYYTN